MQVKHEVCAPSDSGPRTHSILVVDGSVVVSASGTSPHVAAAEVLDKIASTWNRARAELRALGLVAGDGQLRESMRP